MYMCHHRTRQVDPNSDVSIGAQLRRILSKNAVRVIDLFRSWDDDGNGQIDKVVSWYGQLVRPVGTVVVSWSAGSQW